MSEPTIAPCPKCGAPGVSEDYLFAGCSDIDCTLPEMMMQDWNRLATAAALLRAVEVINGQWFDVRSMVFADGTVGDVLIRQVDAGHSISRLIAPSLPAALIALAAQIGARDA